MSVDMLKRGADIAYEQWCSSLVGSVTYALWRLSLLSVTAYGASSAASK